MIPPTERPLSLLHALGVMSGALSLSLTLVLLEPAHRHPFPAEIQYVGSVTFGLLSFVCLSYGFKHPPRQR